MRLLDTPGLVGATVAVVAIVSATLAVCLHAIDGATYGTIVAGFGGFGAGAGAHAAGAAQARG
jgi:hypothetical protein